MNRALPPVLLSKKKVALPALVMMVAFSAVLWFSNANAPIGKNDC